MQELGKYEETVELAQTRRQTYLVDDDVADSVINDFYTKKIVSVLDSVNVELTSVLGQLWTSLCQQSDGKWAGHTLLVLWLMIQDEHFLALDKDQ